MDKEYYEFKSELDVEDWINKNYKDFIVDIQKNNRIDDTLGHALYCYIGSMSSEYNIFLQANSGNITNIDKIINLIICKVTLLIIKILL